MELEEKIGEGVSGKVHRGRFNGRMVAVKRKKTEDENREQEIAMLRRCRHKNVIRLLDSFVYKDETWLVLPFFVTDLARALPLEKISASSKRLTHASLAFAQRVLRRLLEALAYMHSLGILHLDVKPANVLLDEFCEVIVLTDFGNAAEENHVMDCYGTVPPITRWYRPPEILQHEITAGVCQDPKSTTRAADVWSAGCVFGEMARGFALFGGRDSTHQLSLIRDWSVVELEELDSLGNDLLQRLLNHDPALRISAKEALEHPFFQQVY